MGVRDVHTERVFVDLAEEVDIFGQIFPDEIDRRLLFLQGIAPQRRPVFIEAIPAQFAHGWCGKLSKQGNNSGFVESNAEFGEVVHGAGDADSVGAVRCVFYYWDVSKTSLLATCD